MERDYEANYNEDNRENLVDDENVNDNNTERYIYNEKKDQDYVPGGEEADEEYQEPTTAENEADKEIKLTRQEGGKKLSDLMKRRKESGIQRKKPKSLSAKAGLIFPVKRVMKDLKRLFPEKIIRKEGAIFMASVLEYMCSEVLDLSGIIALQVNKKRITPRFIQLSIHNDEELKKLLDHVIIAQGGVTPYIHPELLVKKSQKRKTSISDTTEPESEEREVETVAPKTKKLKKSVKPVQEEPSEEVTDIIQQKESSSQTELSEDLSETSITKKVASQTIKVISQEIFYMQNDVINAPSSQLDEPQLPPSSQEPEIRIIIENQSIESHLPQRIQHSPKTSLEPSNKTDDVIPSTQIRPIIDKTQDNDITQDIFDTYLNKESTPVVSETEADDIEDETIESEEDGNIEKEPLRKEIEYSYQTSKFINSSKVYDNNQLSKENKQDTEKLGNSSIYGKSSFLNFENYVNEQTSKENLRDSILSNRSMTLTPASNVSLQNVLRPLDNSLLVTDRKIIPNVVFKSKQFK